MSKYWEQFSVRFVPQMEGHWNSVRLQTEIYLENWISQKAPGNTEEQFKESLRETASIHVCVASCKGMLMLIFLGLCPGQLCYPGSVLYVCIEAYKQRWIGKGGVLWMHRVKQWILKALTNVRKEKRRWWTYSLSLPRSFRGELQVSIQQRESSWRAAHIDQQTPTYKDPEGPPAAVGGRAAQTWCWVRTASLVSTAQADLQHTESE